MNLKKTLAAITFASAAITSTNAQEAPRIIGVTADRAAEVCGDAPQKWSLKDGFVGCSEDYPIGAVEKRTITLDDALTVEGPNQPRKTGESAYRELTPKQQQDDLLKTFGPTESTKGYTPPPVRFQGGGAELTAGIIVQEKYGTGFKGQLVFSGDRCGIVLDGHASSKDRDILAGAGCTFDITQDGKIIAILGYATRSTDAAAALGDRTFGGNLTGHQGDVHIGYVIPRAKIEANYQQGQAGNTLLKDETSSSTIATYMHEFADRTEQWERINTTRTITTADGQKWTRTSGTVTMSVGQDSEVFVTGGKSDIGHVSSDIWKVGFNTNIGDSALSVSGGQVDRHTAIDARFITPVGDSGLGLGVFAGTMYGNFRGGVMLSYQLGASGKYQVPKFGGNLTRNTTIGGELAKFGANPENHVPDLSAVVKITTRVEETQKDVLKKTTPKLNTPLVIGGVTCSATSYTVGGSTTCSITPVDPQGISSVSATIDGTPVTVNNVSGTYTIVLSGLAVGTHPLIWSAVGKNPDGTAEAGQTATQNITVTAVANRNPNAFSAIAPITATIGIAGNMTLPSTSDPDGNTLTYSIVSTLPTGFSFNPTTRVLSWNAGTTLGNMTLTYKADDGNGGSVTTPFSVTVSPAPVVNTPLVIGGVTCSATSYTVGGSTTCSITPVDPQGISSVSATIDGTPVTVNNVSGTYTIVLSGLAVGTHPLIWSAVGKNPDGTAEAGQTATQNITVTAVAIVPLTPKNEIVSTAFNTPAVINLLANDTTPNAGGVLALVGTPTVTNGTLTVSGSTVTVTPTAGFVGNMVVIYVVGDGKAVNITETATITVTAAANTPPSAINLTPTTLAAGALTIGQSAGNLACTDAESATCTYSLTSQSTAGAFAVSGTGAITIANAGIPAGTHSITIVATDAGGLTRSEVKNITVNPEVITLPSCTNVIDEQGFPWGTGAPMLFRISNCTPGSTWTVEEVTPSGKQVFDWYGDPRTGSGDAVVGIQIMDGTEGEVPVLKFTVTKGGQNQVYIHTAPYPIF